MSEPKIDSRKIAVSSLMIAFSVILYLTTNVPVLMIAGILLSPVPLTWIGFNYGTKQLIVSSIAATFLIFMILGPFQAYLFFSMFGIVAIVTGSFLYKNIKASKTIILGTLIIIFFNIFFYYGIEKTLGLEDMLKDFSNMANQYSTIFKDNIYSKLPEIKLIPLINLLTNQLMIQKLIRFPLALFSLSSFAMIYINYFICSIIFARLGKPLPFLEPIFFWKAPWWFIVFFLISYTLKTNLYFNPSRLTDDIYFNILSIFYISYFFLGLGMFNFFFMRFSVPWYLRLPLLILLYFYYFIPVIFGILDSFMDFRNTKKVREDLLRKLNKL